MTKPRLTRDLQKEICTALQNAIEQVKIAHKCAVEANDMQIKKFMGSEILRLEEQRVRISQKTARKPATAITTGVLVGTGGGGSSGAGRANAGVGGFNWGQKVEVIK